MAGPVTGEVRAEPNLTPLLDVVFQLITFFMLVINFSSRKTTTNGFTCRSPARPGRSRTPSASRKTGWFSTSISDGHLLIGGQAQPLNEAIQTIKHQADLVKLNLKAAGQKLDAGQGPAHDDHLPRR